MIRPTKSWLPRLSLHLRRFRAKDDGNASVEFAIIIPVMLMIVFSSVELGLIMIRQVMLERAVDMTVRDIRLGTGIDMQHNDIRDSICQRSGFVDDCATSLKLEMVRLDPFDGINVDDTPDCVESIEEVDAVVTFDNGDSNELMFLRACQSFNPVFPYWGLANSMQTDGDGRIRIYASSAFVQEPQ